MRSSKTASNVIHLLDLLHGDDMFRACFAADPIAVPADHDLQTMKVPGTCASPGKHASKEKFMLMRSRL